MGIGREAIFLENATKTETKAQGGAAPAGERDPDGIYQSDRLAARVVAAEVEIDAEAKEIRFGEIYESDKLLLPDECEFRKYVIVIQQVTYASLHDTIDPGKGRVLRECIAEILRLRESA